MKEREVGELLKEISNEGLLKAFAALTHRLHAVRGSDDLALNIRLQRNRVMLEILDRMQK